MLSNFGRPVVIGSHTIDGNVEKRCRNVEGVILEDLVDEVVEDGRLLPLDWLLFWAAHCPRQ